MSEILRRRLGKGQDALPFPDLLMVDGGKGQLSAALAVLRDLHIEENMDLIGIAKKDPARGELQDKIFVPGRSNPIGFGRERDLLLFLQRVRDEAHRHAIAFHRRRRRAAALDSALDAIPGIGKARKALLMERFGSFERLRAAALDELCALPGIHRRLAEAIKEKL
jgi:excinuclease ABC subunit C